MTPITEDEFKNIVEAIYLISGRTDGAEIVHMSPEQHDYAVNNWSGIARYRNDDRDIYLGDFGQHTLVRNEELAGAAYPLVITKAAATPETTKGEE